LRRLRLSAAEGGGSGGVAGAGGAKLTMHLRAL
jgi:hypothetical protein